jgi:hypothetical protein
METTPFYSSLVEAHHDLLKKGYDKNYRVTESTTMEDGEGHKYSPYQLSIDEFHRFEGETDPADNSILYAVTANDGTKGTLVDAFGAQGSMKTAQFILEVEHRMQNKLINRYNWLKGHLIAGIKREEKLLTGLAIGAIVGTVAGILLAPKSKSLTKNIFPQLRDLATGAGHRNGKALHALAQKIGM